MEEDLLKIITSKDELLIRCSTAIGQLETLLELKSSIIEVLEKTVETQRGTIEALKEINKFK